MPSRDPDKSCRLPSGRIVRLGRKAVPEAPWAAHCIGGYFVVHRKAPGSGTETYREPFELQCLILETAGDAEALVDALNARAVRLATVAVQ